MTEEETVVVQGRIVFPPGARPAAAARLLVRVEDVSRADAASTTVAQQVRERVALPEDEDGWLPFTVEVPAGSLDPRHRYSVRVHVDVSGSGTVTTGDFVSTAAHPLPPDRSHTVIGVREI